MYVPVRLAATVVAVAAAAGCMSVGDDGAGGSAKPSHSAGRHGGEAPDGGSAVSGGGAGFGTAADGERGHGKGKKAKGKKGKDGGAGEPVSSRGVAVRCGERARAGAGQAGEAGQADAEAAGSADAHPDGRTRAHADADRGDESPEPTDKPEPSSSAHEPPGPQLAQREPAPEAGSPA
ncbi:hypothetical protein STAFG_8369 [Streptomyces afghaniensis 772]|uniref:Lipoprotein n=1 Tax=Streptomyces afghaniensis 772 TaxID=1283301 RepID=S4MM66_9ACTN|nr:hypothetical protein STAFG_8369 [Streptomyces afghaniensis 772]